MSREVVTLGRPWEKTIAFSYGVVTEGRLLYTAGVTARDPEGKIVAVGDIRGQMEQCFRNVGAVLQAAGADFGDVVKWNMYTTDIDAFGRHHDILDKYFVNKPASTLVEVTRLVSPEMMVEIEAVVHLPK